MAGRKRFDKDVAIPYAVVWQWLHLSVHRYGSVPTGELLTIVTIVVLDQADYHPTVTDLADITGLPKSSISRYVSDQMSHGFLEEYIDPEDRRRRRLRPTPAAVTELDKHWNDSIRTIYRGVVDRPPLPADASVDEIMDYLKAANRNRLPSARRG